MTLILIPEGAVQDSCHCYDFVVDFYSILLYIVKKYAIIIVERRELFGTSKFKN